LTSDLRRTSALKARIDNLELEIASLREVLLYLCEVTGAIDEPGLAQLVQHAAEQEDTTSIAELSRMMHQRRAASYQSFSNNQHLDGSAFAFPAGGFQQQTSAPAFLVTTSAFEPTGAGVQILSAHYPQVYTEQEEEDAEIDGRPFISRQGGYFN